MPRSSKKDDLAILTWIGAGILAVVAIIVTITLINGVD